MPLATVSVTLRHILILSSQVRVCLLNSLLCRRNTGNGDFSAPRNTPPLLVSTSTTTKWRTMLILDLRRNMYVKNKTKREKSAFKRKKNKI